MNKKELQTQIKKIDATTGDPTVRAYLVWKYLDGQEDLTDWDVTCFAAEWLGLMSQGPLPYLEEEAKRVLKLIYMQHYFQHDKIEFTKLNKELSEFEDQSYDGEPNEKQDKTRTTIKILNQR